MPLKLFFKYCLAALLFFTGFSVAAESSSLTPLPKALSNNAVASLQYKGVDYIASFNGLTASKTVEGITSEAFLWNSDSGKWKQLPPVPGKGKLASSAVAIGNTFYVIGGYTIANDNTELSTPQIYSLTYPFTSFQLETHMPVPVDDAVVLVYQQRYLYLISGWHDAGNVSRVQIYDVKEKNWLSGTVFPGVPVFGHSAAIAANKILVVDGVGVVGKIEGKRQFAAIDQAWLGEIDPQNPAIIHWKKIRNHPGKSGYRMAAFVDEKQQRLFFVGGSDNPYNYNGIGYDGKPSKPINEKFVFDLKKNCWFENSNKGTAVMDLRGIVKLNDKPWLVGGMILNQQVTNQVHQISVSIHSQKCASI